MKRRQSLHENSRVLLLAGVAACLAGPVSAEQATIIGVYENCQPASSTVIVDERIEQSARIAAQAEAAGTGLDFDQALQLMIESLERNGITDIGVEKRGECGRDDHGKFVEAVIVYCDDKVTRADVLIDGDPFFSHRGAQVDFETFMREARARLRAAGITGTPRMSLSSNVDCGAAGSN